MAVTFVCSTCWGPRDECGGCKPTPVERAAMLHVMESYDHGGPHWDEWTMAMYWEWIEEYSLGGREAFETNWRSNHG